jgi:hypothetical protein
VCPRCAHVDVESGGTHSIRRPLARDRRWARAMLDRQQGVPRRAAPISPPRPPSAAQLSTRRRLTPSSEYPSLCLPCIIARVQPIVSSTCTRRSFGSCLAFGGPGQDVAPFVNGSPPGPLPRFQRSGADKTLLAPCQSTPGAFHTRPVRMFSRWSCRLAGSKEVDVEV